MALFRVALVGCGLISESHIRAYEHYSNRARITSAVMSIPKKQPSAQPRSKERGLSQTMTKSLQTLTSTPSSYYSRIIFTQMQSSLPLAQESIFFARSHWEERSPNAMP